MALAGSCAGEWMLDCIMWNVTLKAVHTCQKRFSENGVPYVLACYEKECDKGDLTTVKLKTDALHLDILFVATISA